MAPVARLTRGLYPRRKSIMYNACLKAPEVNVERESREMTVDGSDVSN